MMKKLMQFGSIFILAFFFSIVSINAQTEKRYEVNIPFEFSVGENSYQPGNYTFKVSGLSENGIVLNLNNEKGDHLGTFLVSQNSEFAKGNTRLVFIRYGEKRFLSKILMQERGFSVLNSQTGKQITKKSASTNVVSAAP